MAFLMGLGFAALPAAGPFLALLALASGRVELRRSDLWWWLAAVLLGLPFAFTGSVADGAMQTLQILAVWLIFRAATMLREGLRHASLANDVGAGLIVGLAITLAVGLHAMGDLQLDRSLTLLGAITWQTHPALFAHAMLVLAALLAVVVPSPRLRATALGLGAVAVVVAGAFEAVIAWLVVAIGLRLLDRRTDRLGNTVEWLAVAAMLVLATGVSGLLGVGRSGFLVQAYHPTQHNVFRGTEVGGGDWWHPLQVRFSTRPVTVGGNTRTGFEVTKVGVDEWARLQQLVTLRSDYTYTLSATLQLPAASQRPGLDGWGRLGADAPPTTLSTTVTDNTARARATGDITVLSSSVDPISDGWSRLAVQFRYDGGADLPWYAGVVVDRSERVGVRLTFAELQLAEGLEPAAYVPGAIDRGVTDLQASRFPIWLDSFLAISARPWLGWGPGGLPRAIAELRPDEATVRPIAAHGHNVLLATWVERGLVGVAGLVLLALMLALRVIQQRDRAMAVVLAGVVILNTFDTSLLSGGVIYALAGVLGWRSQWVRHTVTGDEGVASAAAVRLGLGLADTVAGALAVALASSLSRWLWGTPSISEVIAPAHVYAVLAWPFAASLVGLYTGYGLARPEELARVVRAALGGGAFFILVTMTFEASSSVPLTATFLVLPSALLLAPLARWSAKWLLRATQLWGRPVVVLGGNDTGTPLAQYLLANPGIGLRPVAVFGTNVIEANAAAPVALGTLDDAWRFIAREAIQHVIVTPEVSQALSFDEIERRAKHSVRYVQILPDLHGMPASFVAARPLGTSLALEVQRQLASGTNRAIKRAFDVIAVITGGLLLLPALLAVAVAIRLDSPGPVLYGHTRIGRDDRRFTLWKFRSMVMDADSQLRALLERDQAARAEWEATQKLTQDPRVTRIGRTLRRLSVDELPQLWNVLRGEMSLVGPRPIVDAEVEKYGQDYDLYTKVRPGMTGFWQVSGRSNTSYEHRVELDAYYVRNWSIWLDLVILVDTVRVVLKRDGAV